MIKTFKVAAASALLALGIAAAPALAGPLPIIGAITVTGSITTASLPSVPSTSVVSALLGIDHAGGIGLAGGASGAFNPTNGLIAAMTNWNFAGGFPNIIVVGGFTFDLNGDHGLITTALSCSVAPGQTNGSCHDALTISLDGIVSGNGFAPTAFTGQLSLSGACVGNNLGSGGTAQCVSNPSGGFTYSIAAAGTTVPEPASLALVAIGLLGLGFVRRKLS